MENLQPKLRFPEFKEEWKMYFISDFFKVGSSKRVKQEDWKTEGIPFYRTRELVKLSKNEKIENEIFISEEHYNDLKSKYGVPKIGDLLISGVGTLGISYVVTNNNPFYIKDGNVLWFNKVKNINSLFFNYNFKTRFLLSQILNNASATTVGTYTIDNAKKTKFFCTEIQEQTKIADFLGAVDKQLDILNQKKEKLNLYKKGTMQQLFLQQIRFKDDNGNDFPDWEENTLGEVGVFLKGKNISKSDISEDGLIECIRYGELYTRYNEIIYNVFSKTNLSKENLIFSKQNDVIIPASGETAIDISTASCVQKDNVALGGDINIFRSNHNGIFLAYYLNNHCKQQIASLAQGSSVIHIYPNHLKILKISIPSLEEQTKIANFLSAIDKQIETVENQITKTETYKKGLLQQMFV